MNFYSIKCLKFTKNNNIKVKREINGKMEIDSHFNDCSFKKIATIYKGKLITLLKYLI